MTEKVPREQLVVEEILREFNITNYQTDVVPYLMDYAYCYLHTVLEDAKVYSEHANKRAVDLDDLKLAVNLTLDKSHNTLPSKEFLLKLAKDKNSQPLPPIPDSRAGIRLPPDRHCLTSATITVNPNQKVAPEPAPNYRSYSSYGVKSETQPPIPQHPVSHFSTFTQQLQGTEHLGFQQQYSGNVYSSQKRKREQMDYEDYDNI